MKLLYVYNIFVNICPRFLGQHKKFPPFILDWLLSAQKIIVETKNGFKCLCWVLIQSQRMQDCLHILLCQERRFLNKILVARKQKHFWNETNFHKKDITRMEKLNQKRKGWILECSRIKKTILWGLTDISQTHQFPAQIQNLQSQVFHNRKEYECRKNRTRFPISI